MSAGELPKTISTTGATPPERFDNYSEVISVASQMTLADARRAEWRAQYEGVWGGNPVYTEEALRKANQSWRARANYREMEGVVSSEQTLDYDLETEVDTIIDVQLDYDKGQQQRDWENCIEAEFTWLIRHRWDDYNFHTPFRIFQKLLHGLGAHIWPDVSGNWIPRTPRAGQILFPDDAPFNFNEDGEYFLTRDYMPANVLYRKIANEKEARDIGWEPDHVWQALANSSKSSAYPNWPGYRPDEVQMAIRRGDIGYTATRQSGVWVNTIFVREFETGMISQYAVAERVDAGGYLFKKRNRFEDFSDILTLFPYDIGDGTLQGVKGLGARTKVFFELSNRIKNAMADQVMLSAYPNIKQTVQNVDPDKLKLMRAGAMSILPYGAEPSLLKYPDLSNGPLALSRELGQTMRSNNRGGMGGNVVEQQDRMTAEEYAMRQRDAARLSNGSVSLQKQCLRKFYQKMLFAALKPTNSQAPWAKMAREFQKRLLDKGVPREAFSHIAEVNAVVNWGKGSASAQLHALLTLRDTVYQTTSDDRRIAMDRDLVANLAGYSNVDRYARSVNDNDEPDNDDSFIVMENDALTNGNPALAAPRQNQVNHLQGHLGKGAEIVQAYQQQQMPPEAAYAAIHAIGQHCGETPAPDGSTQHGHLYYLQKDPTQKQAFEQFYNEWQALGAVADKIKADLESAAQATPPEQQVSDKLKIGLAQVDADHQVKTAKQQADNERKWQAQAFKQRMAQVQTGSQINLNRVKAGADIQHARAKTVSDIQLSTADTVAAIAQERARAKAKPATA